MIAAARKSVLATVGPLVMLASSLAVFSLSLLVVARREVRNGLGRVWLTGDIDLALVFLLVGIPLSGGVALILARADRGQRAMRHHIRMCAMLYASAAATALVAALTWSHARGGLGHGLLLLWTALALLTCAVSAVVVGLSRTSRPTWWLRGSSTPRTDC